MDIYSFINSKDIAEHCRSIGHTFTPLEMAIIVWLSEKTLVERHSEWRWIIDTQPDMEVTEHPWAPHYDSLHQFLRDYMSLENHVMDLFKADKPNAVYSYACDVPAHCANQIAAHEIECTTLFPTLDAVMEAIRDRGKNDNSCLEKYTIYKRWIGDARRRVAAEITRPDSKHTGEVVTLFQSEVIEETDPRHELWYEGFAGMWVDVPTPFQKGDIVINGDSKLRVIDRLCYRPDEDMYAVCYGVDDDGVICRTDGNWPFDCSFEYYHGDLKGKDRTLRVLSSYMKKEQGVSEDLLLNAYGVILRDEYIKKHRNYLDCLEMAELKDIKKDENKPSEQAAEYNDIYSFIPSRDIAAHCRALAHSFDSTEQAYIIYQSKKPLAQRHAAWQHMIDTQPDTKAIGRAGTKHECTIHESLHQLLRDCMHMENNLDHDGCKLIFHDYQMHVPVPFCRGDILAFEAEPFVLTDSERRYMIGKSMMDSVHGYAMRESGCVHWDFNPATLNLEYYRGELIGMNRVLKAISRHMKGELSVEMMMKAYNLIIHEEQRDNLRSDMGCAAEVIAELDIREKPHASQADIDFRTLLGPFSSVEEMRAYVDSFVHEKDGELYYGPFSTREESWRHTEYMWALEKLEGVESYGSKDISE